MKKMKKGVPFVLLSTTLALSGLLVVPQAGKAADSTIVDQGVSGEAGGSVDLTLQPPSGTAPQNPVPLPGTLPELPNVLQVDLPSGHEVHQPFMIGFPDGNFRPTAPITRAEAAAIVARVKKLSYDQDLDKPYSDLAKNHWAYRYITSVSKVGYMHGYPDGTFRPDQPITRAELTVLVLQVRGIEPLPSTEGFSDTLNHWASSAIATAKSLGIVNGVGDNLFLPDDQTERQAAAKLLDLAFLRGPLADGETKVQQHFSDVPRDSWCFGWVEEAAKVAHESVRSGVEESLIKYHPELTQMQ